MSHIYILNVKYSMRHFNQNLCFFQRIEDFSVKKFVPVLAVETLNINVLPRVARFDIKDLNTDSGKPAGTKSDGGVIPIFDLTYAPTYIYKSGVRTDMIQLLCRKIS